MLISKWVVYCVVLLLIAIPFVICRVVWLHYAVETEAVVLYVEDTRLVRPQQTYPVFQYSVNERLITSSGNYNLPYVAGDSVLIRYNPSYPADFKIGTTWDCWKDLAYYFSLPVIFITMIFSAKDIFPHKMIIRRVYKPNSRQ